MKFTVIYFERYDLRGPPGDFFRETVEAETGLAACTKFYDRKSEEHAELLLVRDAAEDDAGLPVSPDDFKIICAVPGDVEVEWFNS